MSHFTVAVISSHPDEVDQLLAPFQENNMCDCPAEYLNFFDIEEEYRTKYENDSYECVRLLSGALISKFDPIFKVPGAGYYDYKVPDSPLYQSTNVPVKEFYPTFESYMKEYVESEPDDEGRYGYWENPNAKWDWYEYGGRWSGLLKAKEGIRYENSEEYEDYHFDCARLADIDFSQDLEAYENAKRFWEVAVEGGSLRTGENPQDFQAFWKPEYYTERYANKEEYAKRMSNFSTHAFLTPDGEWHEQGNMGWFATNDATNDSISLYYEAFEKVIKETPSDYYMTIVDCHI